DVLAVPARPHHQLGAADVAPGAPDTLDHVVQPVAVVPHASDGRHLGARVVMGPGAVAQPPVEVGGGPGGGGTGAGAGEPSDANSKASVEVHGGPPRVSGRRTPGGVATSAPVHIDGLVTTSEAHPGSTSWSTDGVGAL